MMKLKKIRKTCNRCIDEVRILCAFLRIQKPLTWLLGPKKKHPNRFIEIDITYRCDLHCINCNRSIRQAPTDEQMSVAQIEKFVHESIENTAAWENIRVLGGEPTLHPDVMKIIDLLMEYKHSCAPDAKVQLVTNGFGPNNTAIISKMPKDLIIENSAKVTNTPLFHPFNMAPRDNPRYFFADYRNGCWVTESCGIGLTRYGYYPCAIAGSIDRVMGFNRGIKTLKDAYRTMDEQCDAFCGYCGRFAFSGATHEECMSVSWKEAYIRYKNKKPVLDLY